MNDDYYEDLENKMVQCKIICDSKINVVFIFLEMRSLVRK